MINKKRKYLPTYQPTYLSTLQEFEKDKKERRFEARDLKGRWHMLELNSQSSLTLISRGRITTQYRLYVFQYELIRNQTAKSKSNKLKLP